MIGAPEILMLLLLLIVVGGPVIAVLVIWKYVLKKPDSVHLPKDKN